MVKVSDIVKAMEKYAPSALAEDFDNVGLLVGREENEVRKILICLDADEETAKEAADLGCDMIISHHPVIFHAEKSVTEKTPLGRTLLTLISKEISVYSSHTNMDIAKGGLNDLMAEKLGLQVIGELGEGREQNCGRICGADMTLSNLLDKVKKVYNLPSVRYAGDEKRKVKKVAICTGGGRSMVEDCIKNKCEVYISGDLHYSDIRDLHFAGIDFIELSHFDAEVGVTEIFEKIIKTEFPELKCVVSSAENIMKIR